MFLEFRVSGVLGFWSFGLLQLAVSAASAIRGLVVPQPPAQRLSEVHSRSKHAGGGGRKHGPSGIFVGKTCGRSIREWFEPLPFGEPKAREAIEGTEIEASFIFCF